MAGKAKKKGNNKGALAEGIIITILILIVACMLFLYFSFSDAGSAVNLFGYTVYRTHATNMLPEFPKGIAVYGKISEKANIKTTSPVLCEINGSLVIARVTDMTESNGSIIYTVAYDTMPNDTYELSYDKIVAKIMYKDKIVGSLLGFATSKLGIMTVIIVPSVIIILILVCRLLRDKGSKREEPVAFDELNRIMEESSYPEEALLPQTVFSPEYADAAIEPDGTKAAEDLTFSSAETVFSFDDNVSGNPVEEDFFSEKAYTRPSSGGFEDIFDGSYNEQDDGATEILPEPAEELREVPGAAEEQYDETEILVYDDEPAPIAPEPVFEAVPEEQTAADEENEIFNEELYDFFAAPAEKEPVRDAVADEQFFETDSPVSVTEEQEVPVHETAHVTFYGDGFDDAPKKEDFGVKTKILNANISEEANLFYSITNDLFSDEEKPEQEPQAAAEEVPFVPEVPAPVENTAPETAVSDISVGEDVFAEVNEKKPVARLIKEPKEKEPVQKEKGLFKRRKKPAVRAVHIEKPEPAEKVPEDKFIFSGSVLEDGLGISAADASFTAAEDDVKTYAPAASSKSFENEFFMDKPAEAAPKTEAPAPQPAAAETAPTVRRKKKKKRVDLNDLMSMIDEEEKKLD